MEGKFRENSWKNPEGIANSTHFVFSVHRQWLALRHQHALMCARNDTGTTREDIRKVETATCTSCNAECEVLEGHRKLELL